MFRTCFLDVLFRSHQVTHGGVSFCFRTDQKPHCVPVVVRLDFSHVVSVCLTQQELKTSTVSVAESQGDDLTSA